MLVGFAASSRTLRQTPQILYKLVTIKWLRHKSNWLTSFKIPYSEYSKLHLNLIWQTFYLNNLEVSESQRKSVSTECSGSPLKVTAHKNYGFLSNYIKFVANNCKLYFRIIRTCLPFWFARFAVNLEQKTKIVNAKLQAVRCAKRHSFYANSLACIIPTKKI